ncbi:MAG: RES domain-containing protein [Acidimicrobiales bacterium]
MSTSLPSATSSSATSPTVPTRSYQPPHPGDGRWQHGNVVEAWYLADEPATAWAEWYRALAGTGLPPARALPRDLWRWSVDLERVALLDSEERLERVGLAMALPPNNSAGLPRRR